MNIEESIDNVKFIIGDLKASNYNETFITAIETLLTAYEKEKERNKELIKQQAIEITDVGGNSIKIDLDGEIHNVYKIEEE